MKKLILVKFAPEIFLKGLNRGKFEKKLKDNIKNSIKDLDYEFVEDQGRWFISSDVMDKIIDKVKNVFGVMELCEVTQVEATLENIENQALLELDGNPAKTFKVETNRANKNFTPGSMDVSRKVGGHILRNNDSITVDVHNPECVINIEIRNMAYIYSKRIPGSSRITLWNEWKHYAYVIRRYRFTCCRLYDGKTWSRTTCSLLS